MCIFFWRHYAIYTIFTQDQFFACVIFFWRHYAIYTPFLALLHKVSSFFVKHLKKKKGEGEKKEGEKIYRESYIEICLCYV